MKYRVLIVEDDGIIGEALRTLINSFDKTKACGLAGNGEEAVAKAASLKPDIILMDMMMPVMDGLTATRKIKQQLPLVKIIALTIADSPIAIKAGLAAGVNAYILKKASAENLKMAIDAVMDGKRYLCPFVSRKIANAYIDSEIGSDKISLREMEVLELVCSGYISKEISDKLKISLKTVEKHRISLLKKLGAKTSAELSSVYHQKIRNKQDNQ
jgi:two-component system NarL family response regulator